jgi:hypothetical protein
LWRTLILDIWEDKHPASIEAGVYFVDSVIWRIQVLFCAIQLYEEVERGDKRTKEDIVDELNQRLTVLKRPAEVEREGLSESVQSGERGLTLLLPVFDDAMDVIASDTDDNRIKN